MDDSSIVQKTNKGWTTIIQSKRCISKCLALLAAKVNHPQQIRRMIANSKSGCKRNLKKECHTISHPSREKELTTLTQ